MTDAEVSRHVQAANDRWTARSRRAWTLDLSMLTAAGVTLAVFEPGCMGEELEVRQEGRFSVADPASAPFE